MLTQSASRYLPGLIAFCLSIVAGLAYGVDDSPTAVANGMFSFMASYATLFLALGCVPESSIVWVSTYRKQWFSNGVLVLMACVALLPMTSIR